MKKLLCAASLTGLFLFSCATDSIEDLVEPSVSEPENPVNYTENIQSILSNNCTFCHSDPPVNGAPISLMTYNQVVNAVVNSNLIDRISRQTGEAGAMPFGGPRLPQNLIDLVIQWEADGLLEN